ncbi:hypothetical protein CQW23_22428 [Capsicum baccatum]|uniref:Uncharacterized protein n=1 Tax=Capsicum baccatum TaxID=33114 RepID=A0A2G2W0U6_CAPBA|nr:hypothetical protein CQW23_22428 [Capsicum baccatum]
MRNKRANAQSPSPPSSFRPHWVRDNGSDTNVYVNQQLSRLPPSSFSSDRMSTYPSLLHPPFHPEVFHAYQEFINHVQSHPIDQEIDAIVGGSNNISKPLPKLSDVIQHVQTMINKRANLQSPPPPPTPIPPSSYHPRWVRDNISDRNMHVNQQLLLPSPPPSLYRPCPVRGNADCMDVYINQKLSPPPTPSYLATSISNHDDKDLYTNQQLLPPPSPHLATSISGNHSNKDLYTNQQLLPPPQTSYLATSIRGTNQQLLPPSPPPSFLSTSIRGIHDDKDLYTNQQLLPPPPPPSYLSTYTNQQLLPPPPPPSYPATSIRGDHGDKDLYTNQQLLSPARPPSYLATSIRGNRDDKELYTNQQLLPPPSYHPLSIRGNDNDRNMHANQFQKMLQPTRRTYVRGSNSIPVDLNETAPQLARPHIKEMDFPIMDRTDPTQLKFTPQVICDNETSSVDDYGLCQQIEESKTKEKERENKRPRIGSFNFTQPKSEGGNHSQFHLKSFVPAPSSASAPMLKFRDSNRDRTLVIKPQDSVSSA